MLPSLLPLFPLVALAPSLADGPRGPSGAGDERSAQQADTAGRAEAAIAAVRAGDYTRARSLLGEIVVRQSLDRGRSLLRLGEAREAMVAFDEVLEVDPRHAAALFERGRAAFEAADVDPRNAHFFYEDALGTFEQSWIAGYGIEALLEASRSARMAGQSEEALELALDAMQEIEAMPESPSLERIPERTVAEASFTRYVEERQKEGQADELFSLTEDYLTRVLGRTPTDPWPWLQLANLYQWEGDLERALRSAKLGLDEEPDNAELHQRLCDVARELGGRERVLEGYSDFLARFPSAAEGHWRAGLETLLLGCDRLREGEDARGSFRVAESHFRNAREVDPDRLEEAIDYELVCRGGLGWAERAQGELQLAKEAFLSMEDVKEGGLVWAFPPLLGSGLDGMRALVDDYYVGQEEDPEAVENAVKIYDFLHTYLPEVSNYANNAGFFNRDLAVLLDQQAVAVLSRVTDEEDPNVRAAAAREAASLRQRAFELIQRSWASYQDAARLAPEDARVQNDTGLIMAYYLRTDARAAERYFLRAIELAETQLADEDALAEMPEHVREDLPLALGDAHQNLGVLALTLTHEPERALEWFETCLTIGEYERPVVTEAWIPACRRAMAGEPDALEEVAGEVWLHRDR